jgi:hypothetical protein
MNPLAKRMQIPQIEEQANCAALGEAGIGFTAARLNNTVMPAPTPIDPAKLRDTVSALTDRLATGDYDGLCRLVRSSRLSPAEVERVVRDYGRHLIPLPSAAFEAVDLVPVSNSHPQQWSVVVPLWSTEEGRSDLSLELTVEDSSAPAYAVELDDLHVL